MLLTFFVSSINSFDKTIHNHSYRSLRRGVRGHAPLMEAGGLALGGGTSCVKHRMLSVAVTGRSMH